MARTSEKVATLTAKEDGMTDALAVVLDVADEKGTVTWVDVSGELTSGQWGRLIEKGLLVDADGAGFVINNPDGLREAIEETDVEATDDDGEGTSWTRWDKIAAVGAIAMFTGYSISGVRNVIGSTIDIFLGPLEANLPFYIVILILALITGLYSTLLQDKLMDTETMGKYQAKMEELQDRRKAAKEQGDDAELDRIQDEQMDAMGDQLGMFKAQFRPMVWIMLLTIPAFLWMYWMLRTSQSIHPQQITLPFIGTKAWQDTAVGPLQAWMLWYFLCSLGFTQLLRKSLNVQTAPTGS